MSTDLYRLPTTAIPEHYALTINPDIEQETFSGNVAITGQMVCPTKVISLNADSLDISSAELIINGDVVNSKVEIEAETERIHLQLDSEAPVGSFELHLGFDGAFNTQLTGFYLSSFSNPDGKNQKLATTQFEATHARRCFPCWDEPSFKATFQIDLEIDPGHQAITNSAETSRSTTTDGKTKVSFAPTIKMSTYLVAFVIGPLEMTDPVDVDGVPLRVVHTPGQGELTAFALECGEFALRYFAKYFGIKYPGDKVDLVAIPDFAFGAMENLGCVTFREILLLIDPTKSTQPELQRVTDVINHELAHMWFGDLVTMKWWNGLWLNEAFATFMEMKCTDAFRPKWDRWSDAGMSRTAAFDTDATAATRPIEFEVTSPQEADGMFDVLTYEKGASVVRMLEQYLGEDTFRGGIREYMNQHAYGNAETTDLWDAIESACSEPVRRIMDSWIFQGSYPLVSLDLGNGTATVSQSRMRYLGGDEADDQLWSIPIKYRLTEEGGSTATERLLLDAESAVLKLPEATKKVLVNAEGSGFYRVAYSSSQLETLTLDPAKELTVIERYALIDDTWAGVLAGKSSATQFLTLLESMCDESDLVVWQRIISGFASLRKLTSGDARQRLEEIAHDAFAPALAGLGLAPESEEEGRRRQLRGTLISALGNIANDPEIQEEAKRTVAVGLRDPELVETSIMAAAVSVVAAHGDISDFEMFHQAWKDGANPQAELRFLGALCNFEDDELVERLRKMTLTGEVRSQNGPYMLARCLRNPECGPQTWRFIVDNWAEAVEQFPTGSIVRMLDGLTSLDSAEIAAEAKDFFDKNPLAHGGQILAQILERQRVRVALKQREAEPLKAFLLS